MLALAMSFLILIKLIWTELNIVTAPREAFSIQMVNGSTDASQGFISMFRHREKLYKQNKYLLA